MFICLLVRRSWTIRSSKRKQTSLNCDTICHLFSRCRLLHNRCVENALFIECCSGIISLCCKAFGQHSAILIKHTRTVVITMKDMHVYIVSITLSVPFAANEFTSTLLIHFCLYPLLLYYGTLWNNMYRNSSIFPITETEWV